MPKISLKKYTYPLKRRREAPGKKYVLNLFELKTSETYFERLGRDFPKTIGFLINTKRCLSFEEWQGLAGSESPDPTPISLSYH